jgi:serine/threonine protein phosphatase PrpC
VNIGLLAFFPYCSILLGKSYRTADGPWRSGLTGGLALDPFLETGQAWSTESSVSSVARAEISVAACTDAGRKRENNEDGLLVVNLNGQTIHDPPVEATIILGLPGVLLAVADGMGGHRSGEVASQLCIKTLPKELLGALQTADSGPTQASAALVQAVETASHIISEQAAQNPAHEGMGTTLTAALLRDLHLDVAQVGDSRAYIVRREALIQLTTDQTVANYMLAMHQELPTDSRFGEMLVQAVGAQSDVNVVLTSDELENGDVLLLCSDGLYKAVSSSEILEIVQGLVSLKAKAEQLVARANENGGPDNVTVILAEVRTRPAQA